MANIKANIKYLKDENGNIISPVTSFDSVFTATGGNIKQVLLDLVYPIGSIYISANNVNPSEFLGGNWEQITDKFLLAAGGKYTAGSTGGSATKTISKANLPNYNLTVTDPGHTHSYVDYYAYANQANNFDRSFVNTGISEVGNTYTSRTSSAAKTGITVNSGGSGTALDIMPPYEVVYMWKRIKTGGGEPENPS